MGVTLSINTLTYSSRLGIETGHFSHWGSRGGRFQQRTHGFVISGPLQKTERANQMCHKPHLPKRQPYPGQPTCSHSHAISSRITESPQQPIVCSRSPKNKDKGFHRGNNSLPFPKASSALLPGKLRQHFIYTGLPVLFSPNEFRGFHQFTSTGKKEKVLG